MTETEAIRENYNLGVLAGEAREQQRIIKMLEDDKWHNIWWPDRHVMCIGCSQIALIKGENK